MRLTRLPAIALLSLFALTIVAPHAHANARTLGERFQRLHAQAARSTQAATNMWAQFPSLEKRFYEAMKSPNATFRANAKTTALRWLSQMKARIDTAASDHRSAISALNSYLRYVGKNPSAENLRVQLQNAERGLRAHAQEILKIRARVTKMR